MHEIEGKYLILHPVRQRVAVVALPTIRKGARVAEEARLESVLTSKASRGFESPSFRRLDGPGWMAIVFSPHDNLHISHSIFSNIRICCTRHTFPASGVSPRACYRYISLIFGRLTVEILVLKQNCIFLQHVFSHQKNGNAHTYQ